MPPDLPPPELTEDEMLLNSFKDLLLELSKVKKENVESKLHKDYPNLTDQVKIDKYLKCWLKCAHFALRLFYECEMIPYVSDWRTTFQSIEKSYMLILRNPNMEILEVESELRSIGFDLSALISDLPQMRKFIKRDTELSVKNALRNFIETGNIIVNDRENYEGSKLDKLDKLLFDTNTVISDEFQDVDLTLATGQSFVAIAAPSMEGKTQSAFTLRRVKPLYFPLSETAGKEYGSGQSIYKNFTAHATRLKNCADLDLLLIGESNIGAKSLRNNYESTKLWTLGYLKKIVDDAAIVFSSRDPVASNPITQNPAPEHPDFEMNQSSELTWMEHYANMESFGFERVSIDSISKGFFSEFCLFLDEYIGDNWAVYVRNLARAVGIKCVCANTNTKIANIVGVGSESGGEESSVWSIVIINLNSPSLNLLDKKFDLNRSIGIISLRAENNSVCNFLVNFCEVHLVNLRPGVAVYVSMALKHFAENLLANENVSVSLGVMMDFIARQVANCFKSRKPSLENEDTATYGKISLLFSDSYYSTRTVNGLGIVQGPEAPVEPTVNVDNDDRFCNQPKFLEDHLFYLNNPQASGKWIFLTFAPKDNDRDRSLKYYKGADFKSWKYESTHFEPSEILTMLACLFIHYSEPVAAVLENAARTSNRQSSTVYNTMNRNARSFPGNPLEVSAAVSVVYSTQHSFEAQEYSVRRLVTNVSVELSRRTYSFAGQSGSAFISNVIVNLITDPRFKLDLSFEPNRTAPLLPAEIVFHSLPQFNLEVDFLEKLHVPFLYAIDRSVPILDFFSDPDSGFFVSTYTRPKNNDQIDGKFRALFNGQYRNVVSECKNWFDNIGSDELKKILLKVLERNDPVLSLIFCRNFVDPNASSDVCLTLCQILKINIFRVINSSTASKRSFQVVPFFGEDAIYAEPLHVCIMLESVKINL